MTETTKSLSATEEELKWINSNPTFQHKITVCLEYEEIDYQFVLVPKVINNITSWKVFMLNGVDSWIKVLDDGSSFLLAQQFITNWKRQLTKIHDLVLPETVSPMIKITDESIHTVGISVVILGFAYIFVEAIKFMVINFK